jgi:hypothetical protein
MTAKASQRLLDGDSGDISGATSAEEVAMDMEDPPVGVLDGAPVVDGNGIGRKVSA